MTQRKRQREKKNRLFLILSVRVNLKKRHITIIITNNSKQIVESFTHRFIEKNKNKRFVCI
jgi:hypothetical protein